MSSSSDMTVKQLQGWAVCELQQVMIVGNRTFVLLSASLFALVRAGGGTGVDLCFDVDGGECV